MTTGAVVATVLAVLAVITVAWTAAPGSRSRGAAAAGPADHACDGRDQRGWIGIPVDFAGTMYHVGVYLPERYDGRRPQPLVLNLHGSNSDAPAQMALTGLRGTADRHGFAVATPEGSVPYPRSRTGLAWNIPGVPLYGGHPPAYGARDEAGFIEATLDAAVRSLCLDPRRVYATGFSGGARMVSLLGCVLSDRIAAIAPVAGLRADGTEDGRPARCRPVRPVPVLTFHGTADQANPYGGGQPVRWSYPVPEAARRWARVNGCATGPAAERVGPHVERTAYTNCAEGTEVVLYTQSDAGHTWPGAAGREVPGFGRINKEISANEIMWAFFSRHRL